MTAVEHIKRRIRVLEDLANRACDRGAFFSATTCVSSINELRGILWAIEQEREDDDD